MPGIVVGVDGSEHSRRALEWAIREAGLRGAPLTVLAVHQVASNYWTGSAEHYAADRPETEAVRKAAEDAVQQAVSQAGEPGPASVTVRAVSGLPAQELVTASADADLVVAGGPTHVHGMSRAQSRKAAVDAAHKDGSGLTLEAHAQGPGLRDWFGTVGRIRGCGAAFDTRLNGPAAFTGHASKAIAKLLDRHGLTEIAPAQSFLVTKDNQLLPGEEDRAEQWGRELAAKLPAAAAFL